MAAVKYTGNSAPPLKASREKTTVSNPMGKSPVHETGTNHKPFGISNSPNLTSKPAGNVECEAGGGMLAYDVVKIDVGRGAVKETGNISKEYFPIKGY